MSKSLPVVKNKSTKKKEALAKKLRDNLIRRKEQQRIKESKK